MFLHLKNTLLGTKQNFLAGKAIVNEALSMQKHVLYNKQIVHTSVSVVQTWRAQMLLLEFTEVQTVIMITRVTRY